MTLKILPSLLLLKGGIFFDQSLVVSSLWQRWASVVVHASRNLYELFDRVWWRTLQVRFVWPSLHVMKYEIDNRRMVNMNDC